MGGVGGVWGEIKSPRFIRFAAEAARSNGGRVPLSPPISPQRMYAPPRIPAQWSFVHPVFNNQWAAAGGEIVSSLKSGGGADSSP
jgi:hypothetical protein